VAEPERPGRQQGLDDLLLPDVQDELGASFAPNSSVAAHGRVSMGVALAQARRLIQEAHVARVLIAAADSLVAWPTLSVYERAERLLTSANSNGFIAGEAGGALLVARPRGKDELLCDGIGFGMESARIDSGDPLRADGLANAIKAALADAECEMHDLDFRIADVSGEHYYFKEAALALSRTLRRRKERFDIWHPAECIGESGSVAGLALLAIASDGCRKAYADGPNLLAHMSNDAGQRAAVVLRHRGS
jgi:3-oxoacyl-[acyl-carrier-protein] synthase-1